MIKKDVLDLYVMPKKVHNVYNGIYNGHITITLKMNIQKIQKINIKNHDKETYND